MTHQLDSLASGLAALQRPKRRRPDVPPLKVHMADPPTQARHIEGVQGRQCPGCRPDAYAYHGGAKHRGPRRWFT